MAEKELDPVVDAMIDQWWELKALMKPIKDSLKPFEDVELRLRQAIVGKLWPAAEGHEGTKYHDLGHGFKLKANVKIKRSIDEAALPAVEELFNKQFDRDPKDIFPRNPSLDLKKFRELPAEEQKVILQALVVKPESPTLELVEPEEKK